MYNIIYGTILSTVRSLLSNILQLNQFPPKGHKIDFVVQINVIACCVLLAVQTRRQCWDVVLVRLMMMMPLSLQQIRARCQRLNHCSWFLRNCCRMEAEYIINPALLIIIVLQFLILLDEHINSRFETD